MNEFCSIIDTGSHLSQSVRHLLFISPYLCCQIGLSYGSLKHEWYRWQGSSHEIDNDEERCHIKSEGATVNIPAQRRIFLANTPLQGLFFFWLQIYSPPQKLTVPPSCWQVSDTFALVSFVCQLLLLQILNLYFPKVVEILAVKGACGTGEGERRHFSPCFLQQRHHYKKFCTGNLNGIYCLRLGPRCICCLSETDAVFIKPGPCLWNLGCDGKVNTMGTSAAEALADGREEERPPTTHSPGRNSRSFVPSAVA